VVIAPKLAARIYLRGLWGCDKFGAG